VSQFFATNPQSRPASGPKEGRWSRELPADWRQALGLTGGQAAEEPTAEDAGEAASPDDA
jgi:hypothetical protein